jgi:hypothetical protein
MKRLPLTERAESYAKVFPKWPKPRTDDRWLDSMWVLGQNYKAVVHSEEDPPLYGSYPPNYIARIMSLFPDAERVLHLFSGSLPFSENYARFCNKMPHPLGPLDFEGNAESIGLKYQPNTFDLILSDPPYSPDDAEKYNVPYYNQRLVLGEAFKILEPGGHLVWLDTKLPMFRKDMWHLWGLIGVVRSTNHRFRVVSIFERLP